MGRVAGKGKVFGRGLLKDSCPAFIKLELSSKRLSYLESATTQSEKEEKTADITSLSREAQFYLRLMEICEEDGITTIQENAYVLSRFIKEFVHEYTVEVLGSTYSILKDKSLEFLILSNKVAEGQSTTGIGEGELRIKIDTLKNFMVGIISNISSHQVNKETVTA